MILHGKKKSKSRMRDQDSESKGSETLINAVFDSYGYDFRSYKYAPLQHILEKRAKAEGALSIEALTKTVLEKPEAMERLVAAISAEVSRDTTLFKSPRFYLEFRKKIVPWLKTFPSSRIWVAGCATGEEVYSLSIILQEEAIKNCKIYATDISEMSLEDARKGIYPLSGLKEFKSHYRSSGGARNFKEYYSKNSQEMVFAESLKKNILFFQHNLVTDESFNEFQVILCRNVISICEDSLRERVFRILHHSLCSFGVLGLDNKESLHGSALETEYHDFENAKGFLKKNSPLGLPKNMARNEGKKGAA